MYEVLNRLMAEGILQWYDGPRYFYTGTLCIPAVDFWADENQDDERDIYEVFRYGPVFLQNIKRYDDPTGPMTTRTTYCMPAEKAEKYIRNTWKKIQDRILRLRNEETLKAIDGL